MHDNYLQTKTKQRLKPKQKKSSIKYRKGICKTRKHRIQRIFSYPNCCKTTVYTQLKISKQNCKSNSNNVSEIDQISVDQAQTPQNRRKIVQKQQKKHNTAEISALHA